MDADLDTLCTVVYCTADDLLPEAKDNARRCVSDAEVVTLCVAQAIMGICSDRRFLAVAAKRLRHLFPLLPSQPAYFKRRRRLADAIEWLMAHFAAQSPGAQDDLLLIDSTPVECARSRETVRRSALADVAGYGWCAAHSRWFWGLRLYLITTAEGMPVIWGLAHPGIGEREVTRALLERDHHLIRGGQVILGDKGFAGRDFEDFITGGLGSHLIRPDRKDEPARFGKLARQRQWIEAIIDTLKGQLTLEAHGGRTLAGVYARVAARLLALAAAIWHNWRTGAPVKRSLLAYDH